MNRFKFHGGDVQGREVKSLPNGVVPIPNSPIAYGEKSGHTHILNGDVELFQLNGKKFAVVGEDGAYHSHLHLSSITKESYQTNKNLSNADHTKECFIPKGVYEIGVHQKYNPYKKNFEKVED